MKKYGLFIGVDEYEDPGITPLHCAARDARELAAVFKHKLGFTTEVLTDIELGRERRRIMPVLRKIGEQLVEGDIFVFFFAGHGKSVGDTDQLFLLPDASSRALDSGVTSGEGVLSYRLLRAETDHWQGVQRGFIFDACRLPIHIEDASNRDGTAAAHFEGEIVYRDPGKGFNKNKQSSAPFIILNSCHDQGRAEELQGYEGGHGLFSAALLETVKKASSQNKQMVIDENLALSLGSTMQALAQKYERRDTAQRPLFVGHGTSDLHLFGMEDQHEQRVAALLADFERQMARGNLERPVGDNCRDTLHRLANLNYDNAAQQGLSVRLQAELDELEKDAKRQRDQQRIEVARKLAKTGAAAAYGNYLATCELCEHSDEANAAIEGEQQQQTDATEQAKADEAERQRKVAEQMRRTQEVEARREREEAEANARREAAEKAELVAQAKSESAKTPNENSQRETSKSDWAKTKRLWLWGWGSVAGVVVLSYVLSAWWQHNKDEADAKVARDSSKLTVAHSILPSAVVAEAYPAGKVFHDDYKDGSGAGPDMVVIPSGVLKEVSIKKFFMGKTEVTQGQWKAVMGGHNPSYFSQCGDDCPVEQVTWDAAQAFIKALNIKTGQQYRLPSETEWEYAARAGSKTSWFFGDEEYLAKKYVWLYGDTHPVAKKMPNAFGLYDVYGNVVEWVEDCWHSDFSEAPKDGGAWTNRCQSSSRVQRGGSHNDTMGQMYSSYRYGYAPSHGRDRNDFGFRLAKTLN